MSRRSSFRIGRVRVYLRGRVWYLSYFEHGQRRQPRVGPCAVEARQRAAEINAQLETGLPSALKFEPVSIADLRERWLEHHEHVRRSSLETIRRYRTATQHLLEFVAEVRPRQRASDFRPQDAEAFTRYLRLKKVAPNGHPHSRKRALRDAGVKFILETCSSLWTYAQRRRHLPPYAENPFQTIEVGRIPIQDAKPVVALTSDQQLALLKVCDPWQLPLFLTLLLTGLRPGELTHLLLPEDLDLDAGWLFVRNKPRLGWQVKTRNERDIPLAPVLVRVLSCALSDRRTGPVFQQRRCAAGYEPPLASRSVLQLEREIAGRQSGSPKAIASPRAGSAALARGIWRDLAAVREDSVRLEFMRLTSSAGLAGITAPKTLRHTFATILQDANVDPLIRNELMGHAPLAARGTHALGMTAVYTHTRPATKREQLLRALEPLPIVAFAEDWLRQRLSG